LDSVALSPPLPAFIAASITSGSSPPLAPITKASEVAARATAEAH